MSSLFLLLPIVALGFLMIRGQKQRQAQAQSIRSAMEPGSGVRTIGGMYAVVKAVNEETVELEVAPGVVAHYTKSAVAAVLDPEEYDAIINGRPAEDDADDADADVTEDESDVADAKAGEKPLSLDKDVSDKNGTDGEAPASK